MMHRAMWLWVCVVLLCSSAPSWAQERCGTQALMQYLTAEQKRYLPGGDVFEGQFAHARATGAICDSGTVFRIPVVFHIIHNGEPVGSGTNLPMARMLEQIQSLNEDFNRRPGTPGFNRDPRGLSADVEFYLACQDPNGQPTDGIVRQIGSQQTWTVGDNATLKGQSIWPTNRYLNIWVCNLQSFLGYGSFPVTSLPMGGGTVFSRPDGIVLGYKYVGNSTQSRLYNMGRTATHEIGHFFGLLHIWGDGDCTATDYCADTPPQTRELNRCPILTDTADIRCPGQPPAMFRNYMGYVYDSCMNIFSRDQVERMRFVLCNTPARDSLRTLLPCYLGTKPTRSGPLVRVLANPTPNSQIALQFNDSGPALVEVISVDGKRLGTWSIIPRAAEQVTFTLAPLASGIYAVWISQFGRRELRKVVVRVGY